MPNMPLRPCSYPGCPGFAEPKLSYCIQHGIDSKRREQDRRGTAAARGYGSRWARLRAWFIRRNPICDEPNCGQPTTDVHHEPAVSGPNDPGFYDVPRLRAKCHAHHSTITAKQGGGFGNAKGRA